MKEERHPRAILERTQTSLTEATTHHEPSALSPMATFVRKIVRPRSRKGGGKGKHPVLQRKSRPILSLTGALRGILRLCPAKESPAPLVK